MSDDLDFNSRASKVDGDKTRSQQEELDKIRKKQEADRDAARKAAAAAEKKTLTTKAATGKTASEKSTKSEAKGDSSGDDLKKEILTGGAAILGSAIESGTKAARRSRKSSGSSSKSSLSFAKIIIIVIVAAAVIGGVIAAWPRISAWLGIGGKTTTAADLDPDAVKSSTYIDFNDAILKEARQEQQLVVWEQDIQVDTEISHELAGLAVFKKTKTVHSYGTGVFAVDMSQITEDSITVDEAAKTVTIAIPRTHLRYITKDLDKTEFEQTDHAILSFGDIKLTEEQQNILDQSIEDAMRTELTTADEYGQADDAALLKVYETYQPIVAQLSDQYTLNIMFTDGSVNADDSGNTYQSDTTTS